MTVDYSHDELCDFIAEGNSLVKWCKINGIGYSTIMAHLAKNTEFQDKYARAKEASADYLVDEIIAISDNVTHDVIVNAQGHHVVDGFAAQRARLMVDTRKWVASKMKPKKYGDKLNIGGQDDQPIKSESSLIVSFVAAHHDNSGT